MKDKIFNFYQDLINNNSEEEIYKEFILFIIEGLESKKEQYKSKDFNKLLKVYYDLIEVV